MEQNQARFVVSRDTSADYANEIYGEAYGVDWEYEPLPSCLKVGIIYAERIDDDAGYIAERGVFLTLGEFLPYRAKGWISTQEVNDAADLRLSMFCQECGALIPKDGYVGCRHHRLSMAGFATTEAEAQSSAAVADILQEIWRGAIEDFGKERLPKSVNDYVGERLRALMVERGIDL